jgi:hypothetical protein
VGLLRRLREQRSTLWCRFSRVTADEAFGRSRTCGGLPARRILTADD